MSLLPHKYTPAEMSEQELDATFAARGHTVDYLLQALRDQSRAGTLASFVVTGPRGSGKSTVIRMVALRLRRDLELSRAWWPVVFPEEQFNVLSLRDFLAAILRELAVVGLAPAKNWLDRVEAEANDEQSQQLAITGLKDVTRAAGRRLVVFVENLNLLLEDCFDDQMKGTLRRLLMTEPFMMLIGSSVHVFDSLKSYDEAFFNYFGPVPLGRLDSGQVFELLQRRAEYDGNERFLREFRKQRPKIRAIVHLSGGNPRLILMLYEVLSQRQVATIVQCLRRLVDELTPLLKDEMERLPPQQRKIVHALMEKGGTAQPAELVERTRLPLNAITSQLRRLKEAQIVVVLGGGKGRAAYYTVPDRLFVIWYQMRYLNLNRRRIELFVEVLRIWFEAEERLATVESLTRLGDVNAPSALRDTAITAEYFAASLAETPYASAARDQSVRLWLRFGDCREAALAHVELEPLAAPEGISHDVAAYVSLGGWCAEHEDLKTALKILNPIIEDARRPVAERAAAYHQRGCCFGSTGDHQSALADFTAILALKGVPRGQAADALVNRGVAKGKLGDRHGEVADYTATVELAGAPVDQVARALFNRGIAKESLADHRGALADLSALVELEGAPKELVAAALVNRGFAKGMLGDSQGALADYTAVVRLEGASKDRVAHALFNRGAAKAMQGDSKGAVDDFTAILELPESPKAQIAHVFFNRGVCRRRLGDAQGAITDYTAVVDLEGAPLGVVAMALFNRGVAKGMLGDTEGAVTDFTAVVDLEGAPKEEVAKALVNRGVSKRTLGDDEGAIADHTAVVQLDGAPKEQVASALVNRGVSRTAMGDVLGAVADYTAAVELQGAAPESVANALFNRGCAKGRLGDNGGAVADYSAVVDLGGAPKERVAAALVNRGTAKAALGREPDAFADWSKVLDMELGGDAVVGAAAANLFRHRWQDGSTSLANEALDRFGTHLAKQPSDQRAARLTSFLARLAAPALRRGWALAAHRLFEAQPPEAKQSLAFLEPVCAVLEGGGRHLLDPLPPEQREFALSVLSRFEPAERPFSA